MIKWHREATPDGTPKWFAEISGQRVAEAAMTGRNGVDDYPWDWYTVAPTAPNFGVADTLRAAKDDVAYALRG